jgi:adenosylcobyric acid synthase
VKTAVMVWGASSGAGKSLLTTALCRWAARQGLDVAPFKAQNMSNNARVVPTATGEPGEMGAAQYFQALAARVPPHTDMNPVLLKPERDTASQVIVQGRVDAALSRQPWRERSAALARFAQESFQRLAARHDVLVIEGAGSPAEINLAPQDYVNLDTARWARDAGTLRALVVSDIDRGGAFAHLYGTWALLPEDLRPHLAGFVLNKFRGDASLLAPGPEQLQALTGVPMLGVLPLLRDHGLPEEDGIHRPASGWTDRPSSLTPGPRIAVVAWPHVSNLDEFQPLAAVAPLRWARQVADLDGADWIILPGSKQVSGDLAWLRSTGLDAAIARHAQRGGRVLGLCGGLQVLGEWLDDPAGVDGDPHGPLPGLGLLPLTTRYAAPKRLSRTTARFEPLDGPWRALSTLACSAYEIRCGRTEARGDTAVPALRDAQGEVIGWVGTDSQAHVMGLTAHGLLEDPQVLQALVGPAAAAALPPLDARLDALADFVEVNVGTATLRTLMKI